MGRSSTVADPDAVIARVAATIDARGLLAGGETVVVAVSGGPDSMTLLHALAALASARALRLHAAHVDHRLRARSEEEAEVVARAAAGFGLPFHALAAAGERPAGRSPEEAARGERLALLDALARDLGATRIATGHTMNDQAETVLMRLVQGTGRRGLGGISPRRWFYIRPLIDLQREDTEAFCRARDLTVVRDPSNEDRAFLRNEVRLGALPVLRGSLNARVVEALARLADVLRDEDAYLDAQAAAGAPALPAGDGTTRLSRDALRALPRALQRRALRLATWTHNGATFAFEHTERLRTLALDGGTGDALDLPEGIRARVEYGSLVLGPRPDGVEPPGSVTLIVPGETALPGWDVRVRSWISPAPVQTWPDGRQTCVVDADRLAFPLEVRSVRSGDRLTPLGMTGSKKVGDLFTDERVPREARARVPIVVDADDRIVWVAGRRIEASVAVDEGTVNALWMAIEGAL